MATHYNVFIEPIAPYTRAIIWPDLAKIAKFNIKRRDHALKRLADTCFEVLDGTSLRDRPVAVECVKWFKRIQADGIRRNWRETFAVREYIITIERWDN
ncbi:MAG: hypothetical protein EBZ75_11505 [Oxalobacteraceae bacterium]|nr:hypothetical protein [Oxalobacteraceae bacterium]